MRLLKESVLQIWKVRKAAVRDEIARTERAAKTIQDKLDRPDEAFLFERSIDIDTYDRHAEKLREDLTLARMDRPTTVLSRRNRVRRKRLCWNRRNRQSVQLLADD